MDDMVSEETMVEAESAMAPPVGVANLGARIVWLRSAKGWSRVELAERLRVSRDRLSKWEQGKHEPPLVVLVALRDLLGVTFHELVTGEPAPQAVRHVRALQEAARLVMRLEALLRSAGILEAEEDEGRDQGERS